MPETKSFRVTLTLSPPPPPPPSAPSRFRGVAPVAFLPPKSSAPMIRATVSKPPILVFVVSKRFADAVALVSSFKGSVAMRRSTARSLSFDLSSSSLPVVASQPPSAIAFLAFIPESVASASARASPKRPSTTARSNESALCEITRALGKTRPSNSAARRRESSLSPFCFSAFRSRISGNKFDTGNRSSLGFNVSADPATVSATNSKALQSSHASIGIGRNKRSGFKRENAIFTSFDLALSSSTFSSKFSNPT
mmetsp:Transcript_4272/g.15793  ORF Transcript_4272/g.15793 Transcript_4272/m.15793 type:complete len:253 (-) Transcript_4272:2493-3251(-)